VTSGILLVDKPQNWTSHDVVARTRRLAGIRRVGHAGTLDPMATGLLVLGLGTATRLLTYLSGLDKEYRATIRLGLATTTDDADGEPVEPAGEAAVATVTDAAIADGVLALSGDIQQIPSSVSAIKVDGRRAYARIRAGEDVTLAARPVRVAAFDIVDIRRAPAQIDVDVRVECSSGTYIRALARDLGDALGIGGHLTSLRRTRVGGFDVAHARSLDELDPASALLSPAAAATTVLARVDLDAQAAIDLGHGKRIAADPDSSAGPLAAIDPHGRLVAIVERRGDDLRVLTGFPAEGAA
jgi:tRNA pseudouridine55 synthase